MMTRDDVASHEEALTARAAFDAPDQDSAKRFGVRQARVATDRRSLAHPYDGSGERLTIPPTEEMLRNLEDHQRILYAQGPYGSGYPVCAALTSPAAAWVAYGELGRAKGKRTAGVDGMLFEQLESKLDAIVRSIRDGSYHPAPLRSVPIPKASGGTRSLGIPTITDRYVQRLLMLFVAPVAEGVLPLTTFACRRGFGAVDALEALELALGDDGEESYVVRADIKQFFDHIRHRALRAQLGRYLRGELPWRVLDEQLHAWQIAPGRGLPQGAPLSPVLANIYLGPVDHEFTYKLPDGVRYLRYLDDIVMVVRGNRSRAHEVLDELWRSLSALGLELNDKTTVAAADAGVDFLGVRFRRAGARVDVRIPDESLGRLKSLIDSCADPDPAIADESEMLGRVREVAKTWLLEQTPDASEIRDPSKTRLEETIDPSKTRLEETRLEETRLEQTTDSDSALKNRTNYYAQIDPESVEEVFAYYMKKTGRQPERSSRRRPGRRSLPAWMRRLPGDRYPIDREGGTIDIRAEEPVGETWLRPSGVASRSPAGLAAKAEAINEPDAPSFLGLMGLRDGLGDHDIRGLPDLDLGSLRRYAAGARGWLGSDLGKVQQGISESRARRMTMRETATAALAREGQLERSVVDAALDRSPAYQAALENERGLRRRASRLIAEVDRAKCFTERLESEMERRRTYRRTYHQGDPATFGRAVPEGERVPAAAAVLAWQPMPTPYPGSRES